MRKKPTTALSHFRVASAYVPVSLGVFCFVQANLASTYKANHFFSFQTQLLKRKKKSVIRSKL